MAIIFQALGAALTPLTSLCRCGCHTLVDPEYWQDVECGCDGPPSCPFLRRLLGEDPEAPTVEAAVGRAGRLLEVLGLNPESDEDWSGELPAEDFLGRVALALALTPEDEGIPVHNQGERWTDYGRSSGWLQAKLRALHALAEVALAGGHPVAWG